MEAVGQLAGGIAHDFKQPPGVISGYAEILLRRLRPEGEGRDRGDRQGGRRGARGSTRCSPRVQPEAGPQSRVLDLNDVVTGTQTMLERAAVISENIEFSTALAETLGSISADAGRSSRSS